MLFSIITVCYNVQNEIDKTIKSLLNQTFKDYEYIIVDGKSSDNTLEMLNSYKDKFNNIQIYSEKDNGIYDAMNKGITYAKGEYIYFLNAGDLFCNNCVLENVAKEINKDKIQLYYGNVILEHNEKIYPKKLSAFYFFREKMICHQSIFAHKNILKKFNFDTNFYICADRDWLMKCYFNNISYRHIDIAISEYDTTGISSQLNKYQKDSIKIIKNILVILVLFL